jgi:thioredoxin
MHTNHEPSDTHQRVVVIDFTAKWCGPCQMIAPAFESMAAEFPSVSFAKVDVDANQETAGQCGVRAMPTFQLFVEGNKVAETKGANERSLKVQFFS